MTAKIRTPGGRKAQHLARALLQRVPNLRCVVCSHDDFAMLEDPEADMRSRLVRMSELVAVHQDAATLICTSCGHVMQFADVVFKLDTKPDAFGLPVSDE
jgi:hypothetical protein